MGRSRYPRSGHRLAPATLRELLGSPVPTELLPDNKASGLKFFDLDESCWDRFDEATCRELAAAVVRIVGRAARMPMPIADRPLPPLPRGLKLLDLDLEVRTLNCLAAAGLHERPQDLRALTIEGILGLPGFWVKCLVDLLTSIEYVIDHPQARRAIRSKASSALKRPRQAARYPRAEHRLAPATLREILSDPVPEEYGVSSCPAGLRLCDLDERAWTWFRQEEISALADQIVLRVNIRGSSQLVRQRRLPRPPASMRLEDLVLENRTHNCLERAGFGKSLKGLGDQTVGSLLAINAFGAKCLVDLLSSLETLVAREGKLDEQLTSEADLLGRMPEARQVHFSDPRLGPLLRAIDTEANSVVELVQHVLRRRLDPADPLRLFEQICKVRRTVEELSRQSLEEELVEIFSPIASDRDRRIVAGYYGWDGQGGQTLEALGKQYSLSRERIRQVCVRAIKRGLDMRVFAPSLDRALALVADRIPGEATVIERELVSRGVTVCGLGLDTIRRAAEFLGRQPKFALVAVEGKSLAVKPDCVDVPRWIVQAAKRAVLSYGATTVGDVAREVASQMSAKVDHALVEATLGTLGDFEWLHRKRGWFQLEALPQYGLPNMIEKILSVTPRIEVTKLRAAVARYRRSGRKVPPPVVLLEFCRRMPNVRVEKHTIVADPPRPWRDVLAGVEAAMVGVLKEHGPILERGAFEEHCIRSGMNRFSFNAIIMCSPVITQHGRSVYGLLGARVDRGTLESLTARKSRGLPSKVLWDSGETDDGHLYLAYQLSKAAISGGVITVPANMKDLVRGRFSLRNPEGEEAGTLVSKNGCAWGLGPVLRNDGATPGDYLLIVFDTVDRVARVVRGDENVLAAIRAPEHALP